MPKKQDHFDYEEARRDMRDNGLDPDYLSEYSSPEKRDDYLKKNGLDPKNYGGGTSSSSDSSSSGSDGCYLTTACIRARALPDDCKELTVLRSFRDGYMRNTRDGEAEIADYYRLAPRIVSRIKALPDADRIWNGVYEELIAPCVQMIGAGRQEDAHALYRSYTLKLNEKYAN